MCYKVSSWYTEAVSTEEDFLQEVRLSLRHITGQVLTRLTRTDLTDLLMRELIPAAISHLDSWLWARHHLDTTTQTQPEVHHYFIILYILGPLSISGTRCPYWASAVQGERTKYRRMAEIVYYTPCLKTCEPFLYSAGH